MLLSSPPSELEPGAPLHPSSTGRPVCQPALGGHSWKRGSELGGASCASGASGASVPVVPVVSVVPVVPKRVQLWGRTMVQTVEILQGLSAKKKIPWAVARVLGLTYGKSEACTGIFQRQKVAAGLGFA